MNAMHATETNLADAVDHLGTAAREEGARLAQATRDVTRDVLHRARDAAGSVKYEAALANHKARRYVREEPMKSALIATAAVAALACIALLLTQRR